MAVQLFSKADGKDYGNGANLVKREAEMKALLKKLESKLDAMTEEELETLLKQHNAEVSKAGELGEKIGKLRVKWHASMESQMQALENEANKESQRVAKERFDEMMDPAKAILSEGTKEALTCSVSASNIAFVLKEFTPKIESALKAAKKKVKK